MTQKIREYLKTKTINLTVLEGLINEEINLAIEEYKKNNQNNSQKNIAPKTISAAISTESPNE